MEMNCTGTVDITDLTLKKEIDNYLSANNLDLKKAIVTVDIGQTDSVVSYTISNTKTNPFYFENKPFAYTKQNKAWVVFFFPKQNPLRSEILMKKFLALTSKDGLILRNYSRLYSPNTTKIYIHTDGSISKQEL